MLLFSAIFRLIVGFIVLLMRYVRCLVAVHRAIFVVYDRFDMRDCVHFLLLRMSIWRCDTPVPRKTILPLVHSQKSVFTAQKCNL